MSVLTLNPYQALYECMPRKRKRILHVMQHFCDQYKLTCFVSQSKVALIAKCSRKHVNRSIKELEACGFLQKINRGVRQTCLYFMKDKIKKSRIFSMKNQKVTREVTQTYSSHKNITYSSNRDERDKDNFEELPEYLKGLKNLSEDQVWKLSVFPKEIYDQCLKNAKAEVEMGKYISKQYEYLFVSCINMCKLRKRPINWRKYYAWKEKEHSSLT